MDAVYLTNDILFDYFLPPVELESPGEYEEKTDEWRQKYEQDRKRHEQAAALFHRISAGQLTAYLSDLVLFEVIQAFEAVPFEEEPMPEDPEAQTQWAARGSWAGQRINDTYPLLTFIQQPNVLGIDKDKWEKVLRTYGMSELKLGVAYHAATAERLTCWEGADIAAVVSFDEEYDQLEDIHRIDPATF